MNCKYKVTIKRIQYNYKVQMSQLQGKYKFNIFCTGYNDSEIRQKIEDMYNAWPKVTGEGETITLNDTVSATMPLGLKGNTYQEGTPTPDSPKTVHTVSGDNTVEVVGKNLFNVNNIENIAIGTLNNQTVVLQNVSYRGYSLNVEGLSSITISRKNTTDFNRFRFGFTDTEPIPNITPIYSENWANMYIGADTLTSKTITIPSQAKYLIMYLSNNNETITGSSEIQAEKGSSATSYEPYAGATYPINLPEGMFLGSIGDYKDTFFKAIEGNPIYDSLDSATKQTLDSNEWYLEKKIGKVVLDNAFTPSTSSGVAYFGKEDRAKTKSTIQVSYCDKLHFGGNYTSLQQAVANMTDNSISTNNNGSSINIFLKVSGISTSAEYNTWATNNTPVIYYQLATPTYTKIEGTLASQLEALQKAESYSGQTNISQTNEDMPFIITASTLKDLSNL